LSIKEQLNEDLKTAMKSHDDVTKNTVRLMKAALQNAEIEKRKELDDAGTAEILSRMTRQYRESITMYRDHGRDDRAVAEEAELAVVLRYMPEQLGAEEIMAMARQAAEDVGAAGPGDKGKLMGKLMPQLKGKADGSLVNTVVGSLLESLAS
jgi:uncharacterized protein YqeY